MNYGFYDVATLLGSLGLFLYGMKVMSDALIEVAGDKMRKILASLTSNRFLAVFTGFAITAIIQSSSATTLMVISFVNSSLLTLFEAIGVILGANIGTTVTAWFIALIGFKINLSTLAVPLLGLGFALSLSKKDRRMQWGTFIIGFALLFIGLQFLNESVPDLNENPEILAFFSKFTNHGFWSVLLFIVIGTLVTGIIQSSSAGMALTLVMCHQGWLTFDVAAGMVLGLNIGTTITANLGAIVADFNAKRAARAHFITQVFGVLFMLIFLYPTLHLINDVLLKNHESIYSNFDSLPIALSLFHTIFNVLNMLVLIGFIKQIQWVVTKMVAEQIAPEPQFDQPKFLLQSAMRYPQTAVSAILNETKRLFEGPTFEIVSHTLNIHREDIRSDKKLRQMIEDSRTPIAVDIDNVYYMKVKTIYSSIILFATNIQAAFTLSPERTLAINRIKVANRYIVEVIKDCKSLQTNFDKYMDSENNYIREEYDKMRKKISGIFRKIYLTSIDPNPQRHISSLKTLLERSKKIDVLESGELDRLIRNNLISSQMATSLANDSATVSWIAKNLIRVALLLYVESDSILESLAELPEIENASA